LLIISLIIAVINLGYRASFHIAAITVLVAMSMAAWGPRFLLLGVLIPVIGWAKYRTHEHNPVQMTMAIVLSVMVTTGILYFTGS
jgi:hypothetical protein